MRFFYAAAYLASVRGFRQSSLNASRDNLREEKKENVSTIAPSLSPLYAKVDPPANRKLPPFFRKFSPTSVTLRFSWPKADECQIHSLLFLYGGGGETAETGLCIYLSLLTSAEPPRRGR